MSITRRIYPRSRKPLVPKIELFGDWRRTRHLLNNIDEVIAIGALEGQKSAAKKLKRTVRRNIRENGGRIGWEPLSKKYAQYKESQGYKSDNLLFMTGLYYRNINIWRNGYTYYVGVKKHLRHKSTNRSKLTVGQIATVLEYGSTVRNIKSRPLWKPSYKQFGGGKRVKGLMIWHIRNKILTTLGVKAKVSL